MKWRSLEESAPTTDIRPLREIFAERKELIAKYVRPETQAIHARAVAELKEKHLAENILPVGTKPPQFELPDHDGKMVSSQRSWRKNGSRCVSSAGAGALSVWVRWKL